MALMNNCLSSIFLCICNYEINICVAYERVRQKISQMRIYSVAYYYILGIACSLAYSSQLSIQQVTNWFGN